MALDMQSADFDERFAALVAAKRESSADVDLTVADIIDDVRHRGDDGAGRIVAALRPHRDRQARAEDRRRRDRGGDRRLRDRRARSAQARARAGDGFSPAPKAGRRSFHRPARRRAGLALASDRCRRALCSRRRGDLSFLRHHERRAGQGRGLPAPRDGHADAGRPHQPAGARRGAHRRASTRSTGSAAPRRSPRSPMARRRSPRSTRSSAPATPMSRRPSGGCSASSAST